MSFHVYIFYSAQQQQAIWCQFICFCLSYCKNRLVFGLASGQHFSLIFPSLRRYFCTRAVTLHCSLIVIDPSRSIYSKLRPWILNCNYCTLNNSTQVELPLNNLQALDLSGAEMITQDKFTHSRKKCS